jgi:hypothetical protein
MTGVLLIEAADRERIADMISKARDNPVRWSDIAPYAVNDDKPTLSLNERQSGFTRPPSQFIKLGTYLVAFSFEEQPAGVLRHLSVSCERAGKVPMPIVVECIAKEFGFRGDIARAWLEEFEPGRHAVNIVELVEPAQENKDC